MRTGRLSAWLALAILAMAGPQARAALVAYDPFAGTPGASLITAGAGGTGFASAWMPGGIHANVSANYTLASGSLSSGNLPTAGGRVTSAAQSEFSGVVRDLLAPIGTPNSTIYLSILLRPEGTVGSDPPGSFFGLVLNASTTTPTVSQDLFLGKPGIGDQYDLEDRGGGNRQFTSTTAVSGIANLLVLRADFASGIDKFTLYVNPTPGGPEPSSGTVKQDSDVGTVSSLTLYSTGAFSVDEIRVGTTFADVVPAAIPEPSSLVMVGMGGLGLLVATGRHRRGRRTTLPS